MKSAALCAAGGADKGESCGAVDERGQEGNWFSCDHGGDVMREL